MIHVELRLAGGLGNQLFQFSAALSLAKSFDNSNHAFHIDTRFLSSYEAKHEYLIGFFAKYFSGIVGQSNYNWSASIASQLRLARVLDSRIGSFELISSIKHLQKACVQPKYAKCYVLDGYFQHPDILFNERERCTIRNSLTSEKIELIHGVKKDKRCTGVHVRRGDYVSSSAASKVFKTISIDYYHQALKNLPEDNQIIVFSDDRELSANFAASVGGVDARQLDLTLEDEFCLLMSCDDYIIANSTFSWWAAYLGYQTGSRVISPSAWYMSNSRNATNPLILPYFQLIEV